MNVVIKVPTDFYSIFRSTYFSHKYELSRFLKKQKKNAGTLNGHGEFCESVKTFENN